MQLLFETFLSIFKSKRIIEMIRFRCLTLYIKSDEISKILRCKIYGSTNRTLIICSSILLTSDKIFILNNKYIAKLQTQQHTEDICSEHIN